jgi:hypothetical protein
VGGKYRLTSEGATRSTQERGFRRRVNRDADRKFLFILSTCGIVTRYCTNSPIKNKQRRSLLLCSLMVSLVLWNTSLREQQERVGLGRSGSDVAGVGGGRSGTGSIAWYCASSDARSAGRAEPGV